MKRKFDEETQLPISFIRFFYFLYIVYFFKIRYFQFCFEEEEGFCAEFRKLSNKLWLTTQIHCLHHPNENYKISLYSFHCFLNNYGPSFFSSGVINSGLQNYLFASTLKYLFKNINILCTKRQALINLKLLSLYLSYYVSKIQHFSNNFTGNAILLTL